VKELSAREPAGVAAAGRIVTFYSYKGGTGRTMALANVACLLAETLGAGERVLVVDWDLEAPGLHRFFPPRLRGQAAASDIGLDATPGLIDLFGELASRLPAEPATAEDAAEAAARAAVEGLALDSYAADTEFANIRILRAGRNDDGGYSKRVGTFDWERLFMRAPAVYRLLAERLARAYRWVLIDSRTGVTDTSGICTTLLPEKLVVVFTPNLQSLSGVRELVERATRYRRDSDDLRPLLVYPLASRIEASRQDLRTRWRLGDKDRGIVGFQPMFEDLLARAYGLPACDLGTYFDEVQIQQTADYAYGEQIAARSGGDRFSLANSYRVFVERLVAAGPPWASAAALPPVAPAAIAPPPPVEPLWVAHAKAAPTESFKVDPVTRVARPTPEHRGKVFTSFARADRARVEPILASLASSGFDVWSDRELPYGSDFSREIAHQLEMADAVLVFWSQESVASTAVRDEAYVARQRGRLIPVMLDNVAPPLGFGDLQSHDLTSMTRRGLDELVGRVDQLVRTGQGAPATGAPPTRRQFWKEAVAVATLGGAVLYWFTSRSADPKPPPAPAPAPLATVTVPNFVGSDSADAARTVGLLGLKVEMSTAPDKPGSEYIEGVVTAQTPLAGTASPAGTVVRLIVASETAYAPTLVGTNLNSALKLLADANLRLGRTSTVPVSDRPPGTIVGQRPAPGAKLPAGSAVDVDVAAESKLVPPPQRAPNPSLGPSLGR